MADGGEQVIMSRRNVKGRSNLVDMRLIRRGTYYADDVDMGILYRLAHWTHEQSAKIVEIADNNHLAKGLAAS